MGTYSDWCLSEGLKRARKDHGLTQRQLAGKLFGDEDRVKNVQNWEQGIVKNLTLETLRDLQRIYDNCSLDYLFGTIDAKDHDTQFIMKETGLSEDAINQLRAYRSGQRSDHDNHPLLAEGPGALIPDLVSFILTCEDNSHPYSSNIFAKVVRIRYREKIHQVYGDNIPPIVYNICHKVYEHVYNALGEVSHKNYDLNIQIQYNEHKDTIQEACPDMSHDDIFKMMDNCFNLLRYENDIDKSLIDIKVARDLSEIISAFFDQYFKYE